MDQTAKRTIDELKHITLNGVEVLNRELGRGSYGHVFTVMYKGVVYAAKQINPLLTDNCTPEKKEEIKKDFIRECLRCSTIQHQNIVRFLGVCYISEQYRLPVMVMELMDTSLTTFVEENKSEIAFSKKVTIVYDVSQGLSFLHNREPPMLHRDLTPNNVLLMQALTNQLVAKIADLGVAKVVRTDNRQTKSKLTANPGTLHFMPPEASDENPEYGTPLDVFSFGGVALYVFSEEWPTPLPERMRDPVTKKLLALTEPERRQKYLDKMTGEAAELRKIVEQCLNDLPDDRPSIEQVSTAINKVNVIAFDMLTSYKPGVHWLQDQYMSDFLKLFLVRKLVCTHG